MIPRQSWPGTWIDFAGDRYVRAQGVVLVVGQVGADGKGRDYGEYVCPEPPMFHRCAAAPDGTIAAFAKGNATGSAYFVSPDGALNIGTTNGNNPGAIYWNGIEFICIWTEYVGVFGVWGSATGRKPSQPIPAPYQGTSQGILDLAVDGTPMLMDEYRTYNQPPWSFTKPNVRDGVRVGQWGYSKDHPELDRIIVGVDDIVFTGILDTADDPRISVVGSRLLVGAYTPAGATLQVIDAPYPPNEQPPVPAPVGPMFTFTHPVSVYPFKAAGSGEPDLFILGTYTEGAPPSQMPTGRLLLAHDGADDWTVPAGLRLYDLVLWELYRLKSESLEQSAARWHRQTEAYLAQWPHDCGVIPQFYCQGGAPPNELWTVPEVLDGLRYLDHIAALSPRLKVIAPFAYDRANGIVAHIELLTAFESLVDAAALAGQAVLAPVPEPPDPPDPIPPQLRHHRKV